MKKTIVIFLLIYLCSGNLLAQETLAKKTAVEWMSFEQAVEKNQNHPKKIFIDVYTHWCGWCKRMDASTFSDPDVAEYMNKYFYSVKLDAETKDTLSYKGKDYSFRPDYKSNELAAILLNGQMSYPTCVYMDEESNLIGPVPGYLTKDQMLPVLRYFAENIYKTTSWEEYLKQNFK